jgi:uncharacterized protein HemY
LVVAAAFGAAVNALLVASFVWTELLPSAARSAAWIVVAVLWVGAVAFSRVRDRATTRGDGKSGASPDTYPDALAHYLRGNWFEAELALGQLLRRNPRDLEAGLLLATLLRHVGRYDEAQRQLERLERFEGCEKWVVEIGRERQFLHESRQPQHIEQVATPNGE